MEQRKGTYSAHVFRPVMDHEKLNAEDICFILSKLFSNLSGDNYCTSIMQTMLLLTLDINISTPTFNFSMNMTYLSAKGMQLQ